MKNTTRHSLQAPLPGLCAALIVLSATACVGDESKSTNENNAISPAGMPTVIADVKLEFEHAEFAVAYPVMAEIYVTKILDRQEFRTLCDKYKTRAAILEHLK